jgi:hypothetical protein
MKIRSSYTEVNQEDDYDEVNDNCDCSIINIVIKALYNIILVAVLAAFDITLIAWNAELKLSLLGQNLRELCCEKGAKEPL